MERWDKFRLEFSSVHARMHDFTIYYIFIRSDKEWMNEWMNEWKETYHDWMDGSIYPMWVYY